MCRKTAEFARRAHRTTLLVGSSLYLVERHVERPGFVRLTALQPPENWRYDEHLTNVNLVSRRNRDRPCPLTAAAPAACRLTPLVVLLTNLQPHHLPSAGPQTRSVIQGVSLLPWRRNEGVSWLCSASRKGRRARKQNGRSGNSSGGGGGGGDTHQLQDAIRESREQQLTASKMLAKLLEAADPAAVAQAHVTSLNEEVGRPGSGAGKLGCVRQPRGSAGPLSIAL